MKTFTRIFLIGFTGIAASGAAQAQLATNNLINANTGQNLVGAAVGNGVSQSKPLANVNSSGRPAVGVGALSANPDHYGSTASVSALNSERLLGVDGPGGPGSANSISVKNPKGAPILAKQGQ